MSRMTDRELHDAIKAAERRYREARSKVMGAALRLDWYPGKEKADERARAGEIRAEADLRLLELRQAARRAKVALAAVRRAR